MSYSLTVVCSWSIGDSIVCAVTPLLTSHDSNISITPFFLLRNFLLPGGFFSLLFHNYLPCFFINITIKFDCQEDGFTS